MYLLIEIILDIRIQCHGSFIEVKLFNYMFVIDILKKFLEKYLGALRGDF